ncbi:radical SAM family heme chaperone HemW [Flagellimonas myxillae]|uniref:radical SAM family heme chaperone HemW n=1 Tax=Flagellimonas myxillae TaxID=2942214 RepID=UPI00201EFE30|nr:radical SAM family heme chaperone HemW [Muricauda myxillae]MCL6267140.1 radical SAM family heme chaperone HemW [Muricauda myxillae]
MSGVYIHIPFCKQACHYCDFHFSTQMGKKVQMLEALQMELALRKEELQQIEVETVYLGGGTPSVLEVAEIEKLIQTVYDHYQVSEDPEITLEANPDDLVSVGAQSGTIFMDYRKAGINRLSIGIQSFYDEDLTLMNRAHNAGEAEQCIKSAKPFFDNISIDLIYGIPGMGHDRWKSNIEKALDLDLPHISSYALTVEPKTALKKFIEVGKVPNVNEEQAQEQFHILLNTLEQEGYVNYEISNFGKPGYFSKNNTSYWLGKKYLGIGPSAHSFDGENRSWNIKNNTKYIKSLQANILPSETEELTRTDRYNEYVMTGLRTIWGVSLNSIQANFGDSFSNYALRRAQKFLDSKLLSLEDDKLLATPKGKFLVDGMASDLFMVNLES